MKKYLVIVSFVLLASAASAQRGHYAGVGYAYHPTVVFGISAYAPFYPYFGWGYYPFYPYPGAYGGYRPSKLTMKIEDIKADYQDKIHSVKMDHSLTHAQRKEKIHELKARRDTEISELKKNYYKY